VDADTLQAEQERMRYENAHRHCRTCRTFEHPAHEPLFEKIDCAELARRWGVRETWVRNHVRPGCKDMIPHRKLGSNVLFEWGSEALNGYWDSCKRGYEAASATQAPVSEGESPAETGKLVGRCRRISNDELKRLATAARAAVGKTRCNGRVSGS
jgi:hypothetical protein